MILSLAKMRRKQLDSPVENTPEGNCICQLREVDQNVFYQVNMTDKLGPNQTNAHESKRPSVSTRSTQKFQKEWQKYVTYAVIESEP